MCLNNFSVATLASKIKEGLGFGTPRPRPQKHSSCSVCGFTQENHKFCKSDLGYFASFFWELAGTKKLERHCCKNRTGSAVLRNEKAKIILLLQNSSKLKNRVILTCTYNAQVNKEDMRCILDVVSLLGVKPRLSYAIVLRAEQLYDNRKQKYEEENQVDFVVCNACQTGAL